MRIVKPLPYQERNINRSLDPLVKKYYVERYVGGHPLWAVQIAPKRVIQVSMMDDGQLYLIANGTPRRMRVIQEYDIEALHIYAMICELIREIT